MTKLLYWRLARVNLWKNRQTYLPFLFASVMLTFTTYSFSCIGFDKGTQKLPGATLFILMLMLGLVIICLFSAIFLFYANSFLIKRRKKEMGLYAILGMEKKHISRVLKHELTLCYLLSMALGLGLGVLLSRLLFLLVRLAIQVEVPLTGSLSLPSLLITAGVFAVLFFLLKIYNSLQVRSVSPMALLQGGQVGEREPKARWVLTVLGAAAMLAGYVIANTVSNGISAIILFFVAVLLVILGTYCLFTAATLTVLKTLKANPRFYYQPRHFITVSGMLYRMKQNAAGLASIAILCSMAMITVGTTVALYTGTEKMLDNMYPSQLTVETSTPEKLAEAQAAAQACARENGVTLTGVHAFQSAETGFAVEGGQVKPAQAISMANMGDLGKLVDASVFTESEFNRLQGSVLGLNTQEIAWYSDSVDAPKTFSLDGQPYAVRKLASLPFRPAFAHASTLSSAYLVMPDEAARTALFKAYGEKLERDGPGRRYLLQLDYSAPPAQDKAFYEAFRAQYQGELGSLFHKATLRGELYNLFGGILFVGLFLGALFMMATALIIYFKQISEGYQDQDRFILLQKVGMNKKEVRATIRAQILTVFFLPLLVAICHVAGSLHMITLILGLMRLTDAGYIALTTFLAAGGIGLLYGGFYLKTAKTYYHLVRF